MSFFGVQEIIENCNYLNALNEDKWASTEVLTHLLPYDDPKVRALEDRLRQRDSLTFDCIFAEPTGFYFLSRFLSDTHDVDKLLFLKDCDAYGHMRFESARVKVARLMFDRYMTFEQKLVKPVKQKSKSKKGKKGDEEEEEERMEFRPSVFDAIRRRNKERRAEGGTGNSIIGTSPSRVSMAASMSPSGVEASSGMISRGSTLTAKLELGSSVPDDRPQSGNLSSVALAAGFATPRAVNNGDEKDDDDDDEDRQATGDPDSVNTAHSGHMTPNRSKIDMDEKDEDGNPIDPNTGTGSGRRNSRVNSISHKTREELKQGDFVEHNCIGVTHETAFKIQRQLDANLSPKSLFRPVADEVREYLIRQSFPDFVKSPYYKKYVQTKMLEEAHVGPDDFATMRLLGRGGFGTVFACRKVDSGKLYAMKAINKKLIKGKKAVAMTMLERHTLSLVQSRFVCTLAYAFQDKTHLFLIMDLMPGGDLKFHLTKNRGVAQGFSENRARFHAAEILLGLEAMHAKNIIFRDLKLENVLLDEEGHCKISDLGLVALYGQKKVNHYAGTPGYIAPEVTQKKPYGPAVDIFSFGVTLYRMLSGKKPFRGHTRQDFDRAVCNDEPVYDPDIFSPHAISLLKGLLEKDPKKRLGCGKGGTQAIKDHPFFSSIDWGLLEVGYMDPPFTPSKHDVNANSLEDIGFEDADAKQYDKVVLDDKFKKQIHGFDFVSKQAVRSEIVAALKKAEEEEAAKRAAKRAKQKASGSASNCCIIV